MLASMSTEASEPSACRGCIEPVRRLHIPGLRGLSSGWHFPCVVLDSGWSQLIGCSGPPGQGGSPLTRKEQRRRASERRRPLTAPGAYVQNHEYHCLLLHGDWP
jgi:hypothetical protein